MNQEMMHVGDIVRVRLRSSPDRLKIGIVVSPPKKMYMVGNVAEVMIDGKIRRVKEDHVFQTIAKGEQLDES